MRAGDQLLVVKRHLAPEVRRVAAQEDVVPAELEDLLVEQPRFAEHGILDREVVADIDEQLMPAIPALRRNVEEEVRSKLREGAEAFEVVNERGHLVALGSGEAEEVEVAHARAQREELS